MADKKDFSVVDIKNFFGMPLKQFTAEWKQLTDKDKAEIRSGIENGTLTY